MKSKMKSKYISPVSVQMENTGSLLGPVMKHLNWMLIFVFKMIKLSDAVNK